jgi:hypothetical protein
LDVGGTFQLADGATGLTRVSTDLTTAALTTDLATALAIKTYVDNQVGGINYWTLTGEQLYPGNALWHDLLVGGTSTASAKIVLRPIPVTSS